MLDRFRFAWEEFWSNEDTITLYARARHAAQLRIAYDPLPEPDKGVIQRMREREHKGDPLPFIRRAGY